METLIEKQAVALRSRTQDLQTQLVAAQAREAALRPERADLRAQRRETFASQGDTTALDTRLNKVDRDSEDLAVIITTLTREIAAAEAQQKDADIGAGRMAVARAEIAHCEAAKLTLEKVLDVIRREGDVERAAFNTLAAAKEQLATIGGAPSVYLARDPLFGEFERIMRIAPFEELPALNKRIAELRSVLGTESATS